MFTHLPHERHPDGDAHQSSYEVLKSDEALRCARTAILQLGCGTKIVEELTASPIIITPPGFITTEARVVGRSLADASFIVVFADSKGALFTEWLSITAALAENPGLTPMGTFEEGLWHDTVDSAFAHLAPPPNTIGELAMDGAQRVASTLMKRFPSRFVLCRDGAEGDGTTAESTSTATDDAMTVKEIVAKECKALEATLREGFARLWPEYRPGDPLPLKRLESLYAAFTESVRTRALETFLEMRLDIAHYQYAAPISHGPIRDLVDNVEVITQDRLTTLRELRALTRQGPIDSEALSDAVDWAFSKAVERAPEHVELWGALTTEEKGRLRKELEEKLATEITFAPLPFGPLHELVEGVACHAAEMSYHLIVAHLARTPLQKIADPQVRATVRQVQLEYAATRPPGLARAFNALLREERLMLLDLIEYETWKRAGFAYERSN